MKKISTFIATLLTAIFLSTTMTGCYFDSGKKMVRTYNSMKAACPREMGNGVTMKDVEYSGNTFVIACTNPNVSKSQVSGMKPAVIEYVKSQYSFARCIQKTQTTFIYRFECSDGTAELTILPSDLN